MSAMRGAYSFILLVTLTLPARSETVLERGAYLVNTLAACAGCHTPKGEPAQPLSGGSKFGAPNASVFAANLTPDMETGLGAWSDRQIVDAIRLGIRPDGSHIASPMPQWGYRAMSDSDAQAIVAYLRSVPAARHVVTRTADPGISERPVLMDLPQGDETDPVVKGRYIATALSHCVECHTLGSPSQPGFAQRLNQGGRLFKSPEGTVTAPSLTAAGLVPLSDPDLAAIITKGVRPDGSALRGPMPWRSYATMQPEDLQAVIRYLRQPESAVSRMPDP